MVYLSRQTPPRSWRPTPVSVSIVALHWVDDRKRYIWARMEPEFQDINMEFMKIVPFLFAP